MDKNYQTALQLERDGQFDAALHIFNNLPDSAVEDRGDLLFHRAWCLEHIAGKLHGDALHYYREAAGCATEIGCRMNSAFRSGWLLMHTRNYTEAAQWYRRAIDLHQGQPAHAPIFHDALYWCAVCLENTGRYLDAINYHHQVQAAASHLAAESWYREICCLNQVADFREALRVCDHFQQSPPAGVDAARYATLAKMAAQEKAQLQDCLLAADGSTDI